MIPHSAMILQTILALIILKDVLGMNQKCYVCIPNIGSSVIDVTSLFPSGPSLPLCNQFQTGRKEFIRECPTPSYIGCLTQINGTHVTKSCSDVEIQDCKTANQIKYCYCKGNLCNSERVPREAARPPVVDEGDDEDSDSVLEGSGSSSTGTEGKRPKSTTDDDIRIVDDRQPLTTARPATLTTTPPQSTRSSGNILAQPMIIICLSSFLSFFLV